jgi:hypothetical protein
MGPAAAGPKAILGLSGVGAKADGSSRSKT